MARPSKRGLDAFLLDVDIFSDEKIVAISEAFGIKGEITVIRLLCAIYRNGYFIEWDEKLRIKLAHEMEGVSKNLISDVVRSLVKFGFFNARMFNEHSVLTSAAIQKRYFAIKRRNKSRMAEADKFIIEPWEQVTPHPDLTPVKGSTEDDDVETIVRDREIAFADELRSMHIFRQDACAKLRCSPIKLDEFIDEFTKKVTADGTRHSNLGDFRRHFVNWSEQQVKTTSPYATTNSNSRPDAEAARRARTEAAAAAIYAKLANTGSDSLH